MPAALPAALIVAGCSASPALERPASSPEKPPEAVAAQHPPEQPDTSALPSEPQQSDSRKSGTAARAAGQSIPAAPIKAARPNKARPQATAKTQAARRVPPQGKYHSWAGIAVRKLPYADYRGLLPHLNGTASWYGPTFHGKKTANGEKYNQFELTAAHLRLPMGTRIMVENQETRARVWVRINDRGPFKKGRILDLSRAAATRLGMIKKGTAPVRIAVVRWPEAMDPAKGLKAYGQYIIQVAAFPDPLKAEGERRGLKSRFAKVSFKLDRTPRGLYSIWAGPYDEKSAAQQVAATLRKGGVFSLVRAYRK